MNLEQRKGQFRMHEDTVFSDDPAVDFFFRQVRVYQAELKTDVVYYKGVSMVFDELSPTEAVPTYDLYLEDGVLIAERNDFSTELTYE